MATLQLGLYVVSNANSEEPGVKRVETSEVLSLLREVGERIYVQDPRFANMPKVGFLEQVFQIQTLHLLSGGGIPVSGGTLLAVAQPTSPQETQRPLLEEADSKWWLGFLHDR